MAVCPWGEELCEEHVFVAVRGGRGVGFRVPGRCWFAYDRMPVCAGHGKKGRAG